MRFGDVSRSSRKTLASRTVTIGYVALSTATMPTAPRVEAIATRTFARVSPMPTPIRSGHAPRDGRSDVDKTSAARTARTTDDGASGDDRPLRALVGSCVEPDDEEPEPERRDECEPDPARDAAAPAVRRLERERRDAGEHEPDAEPLQRGRKRPLHRVCGEAHDR